MKNEKLLEKIGRVIDAKLDEKLEPIKKEQKKQGRKLNRVQKDIKLILQYHDENVIHLRGRIERLEEHTGLTKN